jgi:hypothetical protein
MKDALLDFGTLSLATKDTKVYSSNTLDFGSIDSGSNFTKHTEEPYLTLVVKAAVAFNAADSVQISIQDSADNSSFADLVTGPVIATPGVGTVALMDMPKQHRRYVRVAANPTSSGTLTATDITAYLEFGPHRTM